LVVFDETCYPDFFPFVENFRGEWEVLPVFSPYYDLEVSLIGVMEI
jgi:hypothetical protein